MIEKYEREKNCVLLYHFSCEKQNHFLFENCCKKAQQLLPVINFK